WIPEYFLESPHSGCVLLRAWLRPLSPNRTLNKPLGLFAGGAFPANLESARSMLSRAPGSIPTGSASNLELELSIQRLGNRERALVKNRAEQRDIGRFEVLLGDASRLAPRGIRADHQDDAVGQLAEEDGIGVGMDRRRIYEQMVE